MRASGGKLFGKKLGKELARMGVLTAVVKFMIQLGLLASSGLQQDRLRLSSATRCI